MNTKEKKVVAKYAQNRYLEFRDQTGEVTLRSLVEIDNFYPASAFTIRRRRAVIIPAETERSEAS